VIIEIDGNMRPLAVKLIEMCFAKFMEIDRKREVKEEIGKSKWGIQN